MFCDCIAANACYCEHCVAEYEKLGIQLGDEKAMIRFSYQRITDLCREVKELVGPDRYLYLNGLPYYEFSTMDTHAEVECLPSSHWGYDYFWPNASYSRNAQKLRLYMTGRFQAGWGDHGGYKGKVSAFIKNGGKILSSGTGGLKATSELERFNRTGVPLEPDREKTAFALDEYGLIYKGKDSSNASYFNFVNLPEAVA